jgi:lysophospholipase L1-like esterase
LRLIRVFFLFAFQMPAASWVGSWACSQQIPEAQNSLAPEELHDATLRQIVHLSLGGRKVRVRISNAFGLEPLHLDAVRVARPVSAASAAIDAATDKAASFHGAADVTIPAGADYWSDPIEYPVKPGSDLAVSIHYERAPDRQTGHPGSRATSYLVAGNLVSAADLAGARKVEHWYQLSGVDVLSEKRAAAIVVLGDSITDGRGSTTNGNDRWTDVLARRVAKKHLSVLNEGIGGNHLLTDGLGPSALARFDRDVLGQTGVRYLIVLEGVNDLGGHAGRAQRVIAAYEQIAARARAHGLRVLGGTILPYVGSNYYHPDAASEEDRQKVNAWIRERGHFDGVIDFDAITRDGEHPERLLPAFDSGDHLHPSAAGYAAMGNGVAIGRLDRRSMSRGAVGQ